MQAIFLQMVSDKITVSVPGISEVPWEVKQSGRATGDGASRTLQGRRWQCWSSTRTQNNKVLAWVLRTHWVLVSTASAAPISKMIRLVLGHVEQDWD